MLKWSIIGLGKLFENIRGVPYFFKKSKNGKTIFMHYASFQTHCQYNIITLSYNFLFTIISKRSNFYVFFIYNQFYTKINSDFKNFWNVFCLQFQKRFGQNLAVLVSFFLLLFFKSLFRHFFVTKIGRPNNI
jgi:hypothetical protein